MSFPRYPKYKDSGVEWLGEVPGHWQLGALRYFASFSSGSTPRRDEERYWNGGIPWVKTGEIDYDVINTTEETISDEGLAASSVTVAPPGTLLMALYGQGATRGRVALLGIAATFNQACLAIHADGRVVPEFLRSFFVFAYSFIREGGNETTQMNLSAEFVRGIRILLPPLREQHAIAAFIEIEATKIDALIAMQQRLIELLKEKRHAVISHAVTKGLNPNVRMRDSGIEWLGEVPEHWEVKKIKWVAQMQSGHTPDKKVAAYWEGGEIPWVSLNDTGFLKDNDYISETAYNITQAGIENSSARLLPPRVVVFSRDATIGRCAITTRPMAVSQHFIAWVCGDDVCPEFLLLRLRSMTQELDRLTAGATIKTIGMPDVRTLVTPVPPLREQEEIVGFLAFEVKQLDMLTSEAQRAIDLLQERRTALISAAVTGQIDVRGFQPAQAA